jgi:Alg9-like mannosyltransferase family
VLLKLAPIGVILIDLLIALGAVVVAAIAITGGGTFRVLGICVRATTVTNPLAVGLILIGLRYSLRNLRPRFLWFDSIDLREIDRSVAASARDVYRWLSGDDGRSRLVLCVVVAASVALRSRGLSLTGPTAGPWAWVPIALLSMLPHKEPRYVMAAHPFLCLAAGDGHRRVVQAVRRRAADPPGSSHRAAVCRHPHRSGQPALSTDGLRRSAGT